MLKLNLGCGTDYREGYINVDDGSMYPHGLEVDKTWDLNHHPWPFDDCVADEILMNHILEHLPSTTDTINEVVRILKPGGIFTGQCPYAHSIHGVAHWQHCKFFVGDSFIALADSFKFKVLVTKDICIQKGHPCYNWMYMMRNMIPFKRPLSRLILGMYDLVDFRLMKI